METGTAVETGALAAGRNLRVESGTGARRVAGLRWVDHAMLLAIGIVVLIVSLPRLRAFALRENERDAVRMLRLLSADAVRHPEALASGGLGALLAASSAHRVRLEDLEVLDRGRVRRHGYLFDAVEAPDGTWVLRAWPWDHGHTGLGAFRATPDGRLHGTPNERGSISGPGAPPAIDGSAAGLPDDGWVVLAAGG